MTVRKPDELKRAQGNPGKRKLPKIADLILLPQVISEAPGHLTEPGQNLWTNIREIAPWIGNTDKPSLTLLVEKLDRRAEFIAKLQSSDFVLYTDKGYAYANPLVGMISTIENEITKLFSLLGLTSVDRSRLGVAEVATQSKLAKLAESRK
jgi:P27 family predicted phage terminase small subunit